MLYKDRHIPMIRRGWKTATRRDAKEGWNPPREGAIHMAAASCMVPDHYDHNSPMLLKKEDCTCFIVIDRVYRQPLGEMTERDYRKEGRYSEEEFKAIWREINGEYDPELEVWVIEFRHYGRDPPGTDARDWRKWAYLTKSNWPAAIPEMGPKRRYGPYPWGVPDDPEFVDEYQWSHPDAASVGDIYFGDVCPMCGVPLRGDEEVKTRDGERGELWEVSPHKDPVPTYHPPCWSKRQAEIHGTKNAGLERFA